jgi:hypothetical protein
MSKPDTFTLRLETKLLEEARKAALDRGTSLSALIRDFLFDLVAGYRQRSRWSNARRSFVAWSRAAPR